jgi:hypothetical protein
MMRRLAPLFGVKTVAVHRIIDQLGPYLALAPVRRRHGPNTVLIVDGTLVPTPRPPRPRPARTVRIMVCRLGRSPDPRKNWPWLPVA